MERCAGLGGRPSETEDGGVLALEGDGESPENNMIDQIVKDQSSPCHTGFRIERKSAAPIKRLLDLSLLPPRQTVPFRLFKRCMQRVVDGSHDVQKGNIGAVGDLDVFVRLGQDVAGNSKRRDRWVRCWFAETPGGERRFEFADVASCSCRRLAQIPDERAVDTGLNGLLVLGVVKVLVDDDWRHLCVASYQMLWSA